MEDHIGYSLGEDDIKKEEIDIVKMEANRRKEVSRLQCHVCYKVMGHRSSLYKHLKYIHKIEPAHRLPITCREKDCSQSFTFIDPFRRHLAEQHGFNIVVEKYIFQSMTDFFNWKKVTEEEENLRFIVSTGPRNSKGGKTHYFRCQKNGAYKPHIKKKIQSDNHESVYKVSATHCISSMFVFEEPESVTVEFCRTHYGHDVQNKVLAVQPKKDEINESCRISKVNESTVGYEMIDSSAKLNTLLSEKDKLALINILQENQNLLEEAEELFYENEQDIILKIPYSILKTIVEKKSNDIDGNFVNNTYNDQIEIKDEEICGDPDFENLDEEDEEEEEEKIMEEDEEVKAMEEEEKKDSENSAILKYLGNGVFLDPTSNKRLKLDSHKEEARCTEIVQVPAESSNQQEQGEKDLEKNNTVLVKEYLNENDETVYVLEMIKEEETIVQKRQKILSQLQTILIMVNNEENIDVLDDIENHLSKYAAPE